MKLAALKPATMLCLMIPLLSACGLFGENGYFRDREADYLEGQMLEPLQVPETLDSEAIEDLYYVPPIDKYAQRPDEMETPRPQALIAGEFENRVKIQSLGQQQWILVRLLPGQVWPRLQDFLLTRGLAVGAENGHQGTVDTAWASEPQASLQERYQFRLNQGVQRKTSEVHLLQMQRPVADAELPIDPALPWPAQSDDQQRERLMLQQFANYLANSAETNASVSLMAQGISTSRRLYLVAGDDPAIRVNLEPERAWASLEYALNKAGFIIDVRDFDKGIYEVSLDPAMHEEKKGLWRRFFGMFKPSALKDKNPEDGQFRVSILPASDAGWMEIRIVNPAAQSRGESNPEAQEQMLAMIKAYLT